MIDTHSHILYGVDDGARSIEESIHIIKKMYCLGFRHIIATPHYIENTKFQANVEINKLLVKTLKEELEKEKVPVKLYLGNEVYITENIIDKILKREIRTLNSSNYLLIELPINANLRNTLDIFYELQRKGLKIVLAHPERYVYFQKRPKLIDEYINSGVLFQGNIASINGRYGIGAKRLFIKLLKNKKYFTLASDVHRASSEFFEQFDKNKKKIIKLTDVETFQDLTFNNPKKIINNVF